MMIYIKMPCKVPIRTYHETNTAEEETRTLCLQDHFHYTQ